MSIRHGNTYRALGWLAAASLCVALSIGEALGQVENDIDVEAADQEPEATAQEGGIAAPPVAPPPPAKSSSAREYQANCDSPKSRNDANLCEQRRMADAAEETVEWTRAAAEWAERQFYATLGEITALVVTIGVAIAAVIAAFGSIVIARKSAKRQLRAYMSLVPAGIYYDVKTRDLLVSVQQSNSGQTPAKQVRFSGQIKVLPYPPPDKSEFPDPKFNESVNVVGPGQNFSVLVKYEDPFWESSVEDMTKNNERLYFIGVLEYKDIFGKAHKTRACWSHDNVEIPSVIKKFQMREHVINLEGVSKPISVGFDYTNAHNDAD